MRNLHILNLIFFLVVVVQVQAQEIFIIDNDTLELRREVKGPLSLYWTQSAGNYRYFVQKKDRLVELKNTEVESQDSEEFKRQLQELTSDVDLRTDHLKFLMYSLKHFVNKYNSLVEKNYEFNEATNNIRTRLGLSVGLSNNIYTENPDNVITPLLALEFEFYDPNVAPRHSAFLQLRQSFKGDEYRYSSTQFSVNYRFKVFYFSQFNLHLDAELATFLYAEDRVFLRNDEGEVTAVREENGFSFTAPFSFSIGSDIKITDKSFMTVSYNDFYSIVLDGNNYFPVDFSIGYKYNL